MRPCISPLRGWLKPFKSFPETFVCVANKDVGKGREQDAVSFARSSIISSGKKLNGEAGLKGGGQDARSKATSITSFERLELESLRERWVSKYLMESVLLLAMAIVYTCGITRRVLT